MSMGRISGPLLKANLQREADLSVETNLLYIGHTDGKIGINTVTRPREFTVAGTLKARSSGQDLTVTNDLNIGNFTFGPNGISVPSGNININHAGGVGSGVVVGGIRTSSVDIQNNYIGSHTTNADVDFIPQGTGTNELITAGKTVGVDGNIHATGNITFDGNVLIGGTGGEDNVRFLGDIDSNLIPDTTSTYNVGTTTKRFDLQTENLTVTDNINVENITVAGIEVTLSQGNIWYVAVNGDNTNRGSSPQGRLATIKYALSRAQAGDTILIASGDYEEQFPLEVPAGVTVKGQDIRNVEIRPTTDNQSEDCFLMNSESTVEDVTIKNFFYDNTNDKGYAFRFANNYTRGTRSPYIRNVTVITQGSATSVSDPRGFDSGDAGKGALVDGSVSTPNAQFSITTSDTTSGNSIKTTFPAADVEEYRKYVGWWFFNGSTKLTITDVDTFNSVVTFIFGNSFYNASSGETITLTGPNPSAMLFHSATFITPGVDAITMTNNVRVEWLNSFTYFANRSFYLKKLLNFSETANVVNMVGTSNSENFVYVGLVNDKPKYVYTYPGAPFGALNIAWTGTQWEVDVTGSEQWASTENVDYPWQVVTWSEVTSTGNSAPTITLDPNINLGAELRSIGSASVYGNKGIEADGNECLAYLISHNFGYVGSGKNVTNDNTQSIVANEVIKLNNSNVYYQSQDQQGNFRVGDTFFVNLKDGTTSIDADAVVASGLSSLRVSTNANTSFIDGGTVETGAIRILSPNTIRSVAGPINFEAPSNIHNLNTNTRMASLDVSGNLTLGGNIVTLGDQPGDTVDFTTSFAQDLYADTTDTYTLGTSTKRWRKGYFNELAVDSFNFNANTISVNNTNEDLELRANGSANIVFDNITATSNILGSYITDLTLAPTTNLTMSATSNLGLPTGTNLQRKDTVGDLRYNNSLGIFEGYSGGNVSFDGLYDSDRDTYIDLSNNQYTLVTGNAANTTFNHLTLTTNRLDSANSLSIDGNTITSATVNADIQFVSNGLGSISQEDLVFKNSTITNTLNTPFTFSLADIYSYLKFDQTKGIVVPFGTDAQRPSAPVVGMTRFNSQRGYLESYNGTQWVLAAGGGESVTQEYAESINFLWNLILG